MHSQLKTKDSWEDYQMPKELCDALRRNKCENPSITQTHFYKALGEDKTRSGMFEAPTGTGKTIAFLTHALMEIDSSKRLPEVVIFVHTQILGFEVLSEAKKFEDAVGVHSSLLLGQSANVPFDSKAQLVVATPGAFVANFLPMLNRGKSVPARYENRIKLLVLDEADFYWSDSNMREQMNRIFGVFGKQQLLLFSATIDEKVGDAIKKQYLQHSKDTFRERLEVTLDNSSHYYIKVTDDIMRTKLLKQLFDLDIYDSGFKSIIFCKTRNQVDQVNAVVSMAGYQASRYHGDMTEEERQEQYASFLNGQTRVLITTDMLARGIDIITIALVVNYEIPTSYEDSSVSPQSYVHRIGRAGRFGRRSIAITFVGRGEDDKMKQIMQYVDERFSKSDIISELPEKDVETTISQAMKGQNAEDEDEKNKDVLNIMNEANDDKRAATERHKGSGEDKVKESDNGVEENDKHPAKEDLKESETVKREDQANDIDFD